MSFFVTCFAVSMTLTHGKPRAGAQVEHVGTCIFIQVLERLEVSIRDVRNVDIITNTRAISGWVVVTIQ